jgi:hypothetical protein
MNGRCSTAEGFDATTEALGFAIGGDEKRYLFGAMPIADLFIAWIRSFPCKASVAEARSYGPFALHAWSILILAVVNGPWLWRRCVREA